MAALFVAVFTVVSVSRLNHGGAMPDTRAARGGDGALDLAEHAAATTTAAATKAAAAAPVPEGLFALTATDVHGRPVQLSKYGPGKHKAVLVVNSASACGYTRANFEGLRELKAKYGSHGLEILSFPSNDFGSQEPLDGPELESWARETYGVDFPVFGKAAVIGPDAQPVFRWIRDQLSASHGGRGEGSSKEVVTWNWWKFLVDGETGRIVKTFNQPYNRMFIERDVFDLLKKNGDGGGAT